GQAEIVPERTDAAVEVGASERDPPLEGGGVLDIGLRVACRHGRGGAVEVGAGRLHAGAAGQEGPHRLARPPLRLLGEVPYRRRPGRNRGSPPPAMSRSTSVVTRCRASVAIKRGSLIRSAFDLITSPV